MARTEEEIQADIDEAKTQLKELLKMPAKFTVHGQTIDNEETVAYWKRRLRQLRAELDGRSVFEGPDLQV